MGQQQWQVMALLLLAFGERPNEQKGRAKAPEPSITGGAHKDCRGYTLVARWCPEAAYR